MIRHAFLSSQYWAWLLHPVAPFAVKSTFAPTAGATKLDNGLLHLFTLLQARQAPNKNPVGDPHAKKNRLLFFFLSAVPQDHRLCARTPSRANKSYRFFPSLSRSLSLPGMGDCQIPGLQAYRIVFTGIGRVSSECSTPIS